MFQAIKLWLVTKKPAIVYEITSIIKSFISGAALEVLVNWSSLSTVGWNKAAILGLVVVVIRSGIKTVWALLAPQILALLKYLGSLGKPPQV